MAAAVVFSKEIQDQVQPLSNVLSTTLQLVGEARSFYAARVELEREYAKGLQKLVAGAKSKHQNMEMALVAGEAPSKPFHPGGGREHTLDTAWTTFLQQTDEEAYSRSNFAESMNIDIVEGLKLMQKRLDALRQKHTDFSNDLIKERDKNYAERGNAKKKYDSICADVESYRSKQETARKDKDANKAQALYADSIVEMYNCKNAYLLSVDVSNRLKDKYFNKDLPEVHDDLQALWSTIVARFNVILKKGTDATTKQYDVLHRYNDNILDGLGRIDAAKDQALYVEYNKRPFYPAPEFVFEPCAIWHDDDAFNLSPEPKTFLQNKLAKNLSELADLNPKVTDMRREVQKGADLREAYTKNPALGDLDTVTEIYFSCIEQAVSLETGQEILQAEVDVLKETLGDDRGSGKTHEFKSSSFPIAKHCYVCGQKVWGMGKVGLSCIDCGIALHSACELKCPPDCGDPQLAAQRAASRQNISAVPRHPSFQEGSGSMGGSKRSSFMASVTRGRKTSTSSYLNSANGDRSASAQGKATAKAIYDYTSQSEFQLTIRNGEMISVEKEDNGNGWTKVSNAAGSSGIVPTSYIKIIEAAPSTPPALHRRPTAMSTRSNGSGTSIAASTTSHGTVRAIYAYTAASAREITIDKGEILELTAKGSNYAAGWTEVYKHNKKGIVPTSYVK